MPSFTLASGHQHQESYSTHPPPVVEHVSSGLPEVEWAIKPQIVRHGGHGGVTHVGHIQSHAPQQHHHPEQHYDGMAQQAGSPPCGSRSPGATNPMQPQPIYTNHRGEHFYAKQESKNSNAGGLYPKLSSPSQMMEPAGAHMMMHQHPNAYNKQSTSTRVRRELLPFINRPAYYCEPPIEKLAELSEFELATFRNFKYGKHGMGHVQFPMELDLREMDLDSLVDFGTMTITVHQEVWRPMIDRAKAVLERHNMRPRSHPSSPFDKTEDLNHMRVTLILDFEKMAPGRGFDDPAQRRGIAQKLESMTKQTGYKFVSFDGHDWVFKVPLE
ncbi:unnamed protein product [Amoebophrya sp. A120]|nr:unnamed protein product [Amoebophrya sp. A120]|eukprot:GSA120T00004627001.1